MKLLKFLSERIEDPVLCEHFARETKVLSLSMLRTTTLIGMFLFPLFGSLDLIDFPGLFPTFWLLRLLEVAFCALIFFSLKTKLVREHPADVGMVLMIVSCLDIVAMCWLSGGPTSVYYAGINLTILVVIFVMVLDVKRVLLACAVVAFFFILPVFLRTYEAAQLAAIASNSYFLMITMFLAALWTLLKNRSRLNNLEGRLRLAKANEELKRLDDLKTQFFSNVSHEVRTPLASILGPVQSLYLGDAGPLRPEQKPLIESLYRNALKLLDLVNQMLDFARVETGRMPLILKRTDLAARLRETVATFRDMAERKGLTITFRAAGEIPPIDIDENKLERIVTNLVRNAIKFTERGSVVLTLEETGGRVRLGVEDTGIGIPAAHLPQIFERFHQVDGTSTRRYEGTGIGLTLVKEYVELLRGRISVRSEVDRGTRIEIDLPSNLAELVPGALQDRRACGVDRTSAETPRQRRKEDLARVSAGSLAWMERPPSGSEIEEPGDSPSRAIDDRVVLAEDNADMRAYIRTLLGRFGHQVTAVADGRDAWEAVRRDPPDVVVSDIMMPGMDGYELLRAVKSDPQTAAVPVILITAKPELEAKLKGLEFGADDYLTKPVNVRELDARIRNLIAGRRLQQSRQRLEETERLMEERRKGFETLLRTLDALVQSVALIVEMRDPYTAGHQRRTADLAAALGVEMGFSPDRLDGLRTAGRLHDLGKISVPAEILSKPSRLTEIEFGLIKGHPQAGFDILKDIEFPWPVARIVLEHHERMDGSGYPYGRRGEEMLLESRILAVADVVEAISTHRPYRPALGLEAALFEIDTRRGSFFDPDVVEACLRLFREKDYQFPA